MMIPFEFETIAFGFETIEKATSPKDTHIPSCPHNLWPYELTAPDNRFRTSSFPKTTMKIILLGSPLISIACTVVLASTFVSDQALAQSFQVVSRATSTIPTSREVTFSCTFQNNWSSANHPRLYPTATAHWSPPVLATHNGGYRMWLPGGLASPGVESVAETGATTTLVNEIASAGSAIRSSVRGVDQFNSEQQRQVLPNIAADASHRLMSSITMVAPSPDWFTGFYDFRLFNPSTGTWWSNFTLNTFPFDAGTEKGTSYVLSNEAENPRLRIRRFTARSPLDTGVFLSSDQSTVRHVATWKCQMRTSTASCLRATTSCSRNAECCSGNCMVSGGKKTCASTRGRQLRGTVGSDKGTVEVVSDTVGVTPDRDQ